MRRFRQPSILPGFGLTLGFTAFFLSAIVLIPLAALIIKGSSPDLAQLKDILLDRRALASYRLSFGPRSSPQPSTPCSASSSRGRWCATSSRAGGWWTR